VSHFQQWNFGARLLHRPLDPQVILAEIGRYNAADAAEVSRRIRASAGLDAQVDQLVALYREVLAEWKHTSPPSRSSEARAAATAVWAVRPPLPLRERIRRISFLGTALVAIKRLVFGPRPWR
jgi:hypothetical protein